MSEPFSHDERQWIAQKLLRGAGLRIGSLLAARVLSAVRLVVFARLFTPEVVGIAALALTCVILASGFANFGFFESVLRAPARGTRDPANTSFTLSLITGGIVTAAIVACAPLLSDLFVADITNYVRALAIVALTIPLTFPRILWHRNLDFSHPSVAVVLSEAVILVGALVAELVFGLGVWSIVLGYIAGLLVSASYLWLATQERPGLELDREQSRGLLSFGWPFMLQSLNSQVMARGDNALVGKFAGTSALAYYNYAWNIPTMIGSLASTVDSMLLPVYARLNDVPGQVSRLFNLACKMWSVIGSFFGFACIVFADELVHVLFGERWKPVVPLLQVMMISFIIRFCSGYAYNNLVLLRGRTRYMMMWGFVNTALVFSLGLFLIREHGALGGAWFWVLQALVLAPAIRFPLIRHELGDLRFLLHVWQPVIAGLAALATAYGLLTVDDAGEWVLLSLAMYVVVYVTTLVSIDRLLLRELKTFWSLARQSP